MESVLVGAGGSNPGGRVDGGEEELPRRAITDVIKARKKRQ